MFRNAIKVYGRVKRQCNESSPQNYDIRKQKDYEEIVFNTDMIGDYAREFGYYKLNKHRYRFCSVFDESATQVDVFNVIAKPVVNSVLEGYNGTIFAYGQTGSGKTYSMTGASEYETRGIIPRTIQYIFQHIQNSPTILYNIYISYLEIYNEIGYDLLNPKHRAAFLEDLPRVTTLEDAKGQIHLRNLGVISVASEREAMCLLFLGDTNRTIAETPMNMYSSRSHCIFTVYVAATLTEDGRVRRSKLHLVDLAGSERIQKSCITGNLLVDARQINLSLHYLEQVIIALSDEKRSHVPYRNSMMTSVLRDSLGGNCLTTMLATLSADPRNFEETITTCKFAQRVALVNSDVYINEDEDPEVKIGKLELEIENLKKELVIYKGPFKYSLQEKRQLTPEQIKECEEQISAYIESSSDDFPVEEDVNKVLTYFKIFKKIIKSQMEKANNENMQTSKSFEQIVKQKDSEICTLSRLLSKEKLRTKEVGKNLVITLPQQSCSNVSISSSQSETRAFETFLRNEQSKSEMSKCAAALKEKILQAKMIAERIERCKENIMSLKVKVRENINNNPEVADMVMTQLQRQQDIYRESIMSLSNLKTEIDHLSHSYEQERLRTIKRFQTWYSNTSQKSQNLPSNAPIENSISLPDKQEVFNYKYQSSDAFPQNYVPHVATRTNISNISADNSPYLHEYEPNYPQFHGNSHLPPETRSQYYSYNSSNSPNFQSKNHGSAPDSSYMYLNLNNYSSQRVTATNYLQQNQPSSAAVLEKQYCRPETYPKHGEMSKFHPNTPYSKFENNERIERNMAYSGPLMVSLGSRTANKNDECIEYDGYDVPEKLINYPEMSNRYSGDDKYSLNYHSVRNNCFENRECRRRENNTTENMAKIGSSCTVNEKVASENYLDTIPLTGDPEVDEEIIAFYRAKDNISNNSINK